MREPLQEDLNWVVFNIFSFVSLFTLSLPHPGIMIGLIKGSLTSWNPMSPWENQIPPWETRSSPWGTRGLPWDTRSPPLGTGVHREGSCFFLLVPLHWYPCRGLPVTWSRWLFVSTDHFASRVPSLPGTFSRVRPIIVYFRRPTNLFFKLSF